MAIGRCFCGSDVDARSSPLNKELMLSGTHFRPFLGPFCSGPAAMLSCLYTFTDQGIWAQWAWGEPGLSKLAPDIWHSICITLHKRL